MQAILQQIKNLGGVRLAVIGGVSLAALGFVIYLLTRLGGPEMGMMYGEVDAAEMSKVTQRLDQMGMKYELRADGTQVWVPLEAITKTRVTLAGEGIPRQGSLGNALFDQDKGLATSSFVQNINQRRALEGELERTLTSIENIKSARVHLVLPTRELFSRERQDPSASVLLRMKTTQRLERPQVKAVQHLIAAAVPNLKPDRISIIDERGALVAAGADSTHGSLLANAEEARVGHEQRVARAVENLLERALGFGKVRAEVSATVDYDRVVENQELFDPDQVVVRSTQSVTDTAEQTESDGNPSVTIANNLPIAANSPITGTISQSRSSRTEETTNNEIGRTVRNKQREPGGLKKVSIAVLVDGTYSFNDGKRVYNPRSQREIEHLESLVKASIGFDPQRGDEVSVVNMQFLTEADELPPQQKLFGLDRAELIKLAEILVLGAVGLLVLLLVVRPLLTRLFEAVPSAATPSAGAALLGGGSLAAQLGGPGGRDLSSAPAVEISDSIDEMIDLNRIEGRVKASSLRKIGEIVEKHPEDVVAIIRNWLYQET